MQESLRKAEASAARSQAEAKAANEKRMAMEKDVLALKFPPPQKNRLQTHPNKRKATYSVEFRLQRGCDGGFFFFWICGSSCQDTQVYSFPFSISLLSASKAFSAASAFLRQYFTAKFSKPRPESSVTRLMRNASISSA